jgi:hypothetical protein
MKLLDSFEMSLITEHKAHFGTPQCFGNEDISPEKPSVTKPVEHGRIHAMWKFDKE